MADPYLLIIKIGLSHKLHKKKSYMLTQLQTQKRKKKNELFPLIFLK